MNAVDLRGVVFGRLVAIAPTEKRKNGIVWLCRCACGRETEVPAGTLRYGTTRSCGCASREATIRRNIATATHGRSGDPTYVTWVEMRRRCTATGRDNASSYTARGVVVCKRWADSFENFLADMGPRPTGKTLDRWPDQAGNYEPGNCRWATPREQSSNRRGNRYVDFSGEMLTVAEVARRLGKSRCGVYGMLRDGRLSRWAE